ncbi:PSP1-domain-containing protein [Mucor ambiguus]|uniref:PSP1-domain-containing protein n=1 Tax=Mucor ambiguus TaxID=91626 RepID=A0A0C9MDZ0_9FUNG|nr:PSP1-domain-containing protein [Mucor ambiguus]
MATYYNTLTAENQKDEKNDEHWFLDSNHLKQQNELYNIVPSNTTSNSSTTTTTTNDFSLESYPWSIAPLSPPMAKKEQTTSPVSHRPPATTSHSGVAWHALWSTSTWQNSNGTTAITEPQKRSRSISSMQLPSSFYDTCSTADDYFYRAHSSNIGGGKQDYNCSNKSPLPSPLASTGFMTNDADKTSSIWSFDYNNNPLMRLDDRRHSIAVTHQHYVRPITPPPSHPLQQPPKQKQKHPHQQQHQQQLPAQHVMQQQQIDEYFSPTTAAIDVQYLGKGLSVDQLEPEQTVYLVQFKGAYRSDWFYIQHDDKILIQLNETVIVEADRGYDLGKIIDISQRSCLEKSITSVKRIFRHANPAELATHQLKQQDEQTALVICQAKIKQKNLNMEVVDAEYQWDRRKLTFYFKANERIDFRELVRELFKIYKTRIWMCAYASINH